MTEKLHFTIGKRETMRGILENKIRKVYLALDADENFRKEFEENCLSYGVEIENVPSKDLLGKKVGINVSCGVLGCLKPSNN